MQKAAQQLLANLQIVGVVLLCCKNLRTTTSGVELRIIQLYIAFEKNFATGLSVLKQFCNTTFSHVLTPAVIPIKLLPDQVQDVREPFVIGWVPESAVGIL